MLLLTRPYTLAEVSDSGAKCDAIAMENSSTALRTDFNIVIDCFVWSLKKRWVRLR